MSNGNKDSYIESRIKAFEQELDELVDKIGISYVKDETAIEALSLTYQQLSKMDQQECCILAYQIQQYGLYVQSVYNRLKNIEKWCERALEVMIAKQPAIDGIYKKFEEKRASIIVENSAAEAINKISLKSGCKAQEIYNVNQKISTMSETLKELSKSKRYGQRNS